MISHRKWMAPAVVSYNITESIYFVLLSQLVIHFYHHMKSYRPANTFHTLCKNHEVWQECSLQSPVLPYSLSFFRDNIHLSFKQLFKSSAVSEAEAALSSYNSFCNNLPHQPVWALAENYRFEPAFVEVPIF